MQPAVVNPEFARDHGFDNPTAVRVISLNSQRMSPTLPADARLMGTATDRNRLTNGQIVAVHAQLGKHHVCHVGRYSSIENDRLQLRFDNPDNPETMRFELGTVRAIYADLSIIGGIVA